MGSLKIYRQLVLYTGFIALMIFAFSQRVGQGWYFHNDGVTIACSLESVADLLHPGKWEVLGCTFDHQPLYHLIVKAIGHWRGYELALFQWLNVLFYILGWLYFTIHISRKHHWLLTGAVAFFVLSSFYLLYWTQELRMYALYVFGCFFLITEMERLDEEVTFGRLGLHLLNYFNFYMYALPLTLYLFCRLKRNGLNDRRIVGFTLLMSLLLVLKTPSVIFWRFVRRQGNLSVDSNEILNFLGNNLMQGIPAYEVVGWSLLILSIIWALIKMNPSPRKWSYFILLFLPLPAVMAGTVLLSLHEIELRYFLFIYPIFSLMAIQLLDQIKLRPIKIILALGLISLGAYNAGQVPLRGAHAIADIRATAEFVAQNIWHKEVIYVDDKYFFFSYVGIYAQLLTNHRPLIEKLDKPINAGSVFISVHLGPKEHEEKIIEHGLKFKTIWSAKNMLSQRTIITEIYPDN
jgi:hypothetical protein